MSLSLTCHTAKMDVSGTVIQQSVNYLSGAGETYRFSDKNRVRARQWAAVTVKPWSDDGHRLYYASPPRCGGARDAKRKEEKKRAALMTELSRNLAAMYSTGLGMDGGEGISGEVRGNMIKEAAELLLAELSQQKAKEKEMKKRKKDEREALKAAKMRNHCAEMSSSSSSSESSDSDCEEVVVMNKPRKDLQEQVKPNILDVPVHSPEVEAVEKFKIESELSSSNCINGAGVVRCSGSMIAVAKSLDKIEVCMGGKCKKAGAADLLQEFEKKVGMEGAVVGCKCMGKCKEGPNVRIVNHCRSPDELAVQVSKKPLCIGVGLEDVSAIVANFLGDENMDMGLLAA